MYESHSDKTGLFNPKFKNILSEKINVDIAKVKKVPESIRASFNRYLSLNRNKISTICIDNIKYGFLLSFKNKILVFYVENSGELSGYVASEISEKKIIKFLRYLKSF